VDIGLVGRPANILPSPIEKDGKLDGLIDPLHRIIVCTLCRDIPTGTRSGEALCDDLRSRLSAHHEPDVAHGFTVEGVACMAGCARPLTVAFQAPGKAAYLFGSIDAEADAGDLVRFARLYASLPDGWCNSGQRPPRLAGKTLARIPGGIAGERR
jgi:predicted metal-binding protein